MVAASIAVHYLYAVTGILPTARPTLEEMIRFDVDYTFWLNLVFGSVAPVLLALHRRGGNGRHETAGGDMEASPTKA